MSETADKLKQSLDALKATYGHDELKTAAEALLGHLTVTRQLPAEYSRLLSPEALEQTAYTLDASIDDILATGQNKESAYGNKGDLLKEKWDLENRIKAEEAAAIMNGGEDPKFITWEGVKYPFNNDTSRDAFRRTVSKESRKRLAEVEGQLAALDIESYKAKDAWEIAVQNASQVRIRGELQARLLAFLAGGQ
ncbi:hypothetical protein [Paenibacillus sp. FSL R5-0908]|uniref:hypothetical protein n=1 Tax=Paenibacillus sp. FSL R5-0908 TaxID=2921664 RepID=UPI0030F54041